MAVCPVCGCKTEALDFVESKIGALDISVCSFCSKQLNLLNSDNAGEAQLNWLKAVVAKEVPEREPEAFAALQALLEKHGLSVAPPEQPAEAYSPPVKATAKKANSAENQTDKDAQIAELTKRVEKLEKKLLDMRRSMLIKTICEIALPLILGIIILIIFFSSDFYGQISYLFSSFM